MVRTLVVGMALVALLSTVFSPAANATAPNATASTVPHASAVSHVAAPRSAGSVTPAAVPGTFRELQMNLCNSGKATDCYTGGRSIDEADALMRTLSGSRVPPDLLTVNEICLGDVTGPLSTTMAQIWPSDYTYYLFVPALDATTASDPSQMRPITCTDGDSYGSAVIGHVPAARWAGLDTVYGVYTAQSPVAEQRAYGCVYVTGNYYGCVTHLTNLSAPIALSQCKQLMSTVIPAFTSHEGVSLPTVVGGDLNLKYDTSSANNVQKCVPAGYYRKGDGSVQHVMATANMTFQRTDTFAMYYTDHNAFMVTMTMP